MGVQTEKTRRLRLCPKLTRDHIWLNPYTPVHKLIEQYALNSGNSWLTLIHAEWNGGHSTAVLDQDKRRKTHLFIWMIDWLFNTVNPLDCRHKRKDSRDPYYTVQTLNIRRCIFCVAWSYRLLGGFFLWGYVITMWEEKALQGVIPSNSG